MKTSLPYRRTDRAILNAFVTLSTRIPFEKMTVRDILDEALISRYTFYVHFPDKYAVAERLQNDMYQEFLIFMRQRIPEIDAQSLPSETHHTMIDTAIWEFSEKHHAQMQAIKNIHTETIDYMRLIQDYIKEAYKKTVLPHEGIALEAEIYANMVTAVMEYRDSDPITPCSESLQSAYVNATLYALGIHDEKRVQAGRMQMMNFVKGRI